MHFCLLVYLYTACIQLLRNPEEGVRSSEIRLRDGCYLPCGYCEPYPHPLQEQQGLFNPEPSLQPPITVLLKGIKEFYHWVKFKSQFTLLG